MSIYRGPGGSGDAVNDAASEASLISQLVTQAQQSEAAAAASATAAQTAENNAETAETNAELAETNAEAAQAAAEAAQLAAEVAQAAAELAETNAETAETNAETAQAAAEAAQLAAEAAQLAAETAETNAETAETNAETAALNASNSEIAAAASAAAAAASFDAFDDIYLGAKASDPTLDNDGNALTSGDQYFNTVANELRVWNGSSWQAASVIGGTVTTLTVTGSTSLQAVSATSITDSGNLTFTGTGNRITGDFSNATLANRVAFQNSTTNAGTNINILPNGTALGSFICAFNNSDPTNAAFAQLGTTAGTEIRLASAVTGTGTYLPITMYTGGSERLRIDTSGNVGIGTTSPSQKLVVSDNNTGQTLVNIINTSAGGYSWNIGTVGSAAGLAPVGTFIVRDSTNGVNRIAIDTSGNVGIGTSSNSYTAAGRGNLNIAGSSSAILGFQIGGSAKGYYFHNGTDLQMWNEVAGANVFGTNATERMRIDSSGNVGIGTSSPSWLLSLSKSSAGGSIGQYPVVQINNANASGYAALYLNDSTALAGLETQRNTGHLGLYAGGTERMRIDSAGNVGIGTSSPALTLNVKSPSSDYRVALFETASTNGPSVQIKGSKTYELRSTNTGASEGGGLFFIYDKDNEISRLTINSSGNVGIGTSSPVGSMQLVRSSDPQFIITDDGTSSFSFGTTTGYSSIGTDAAAITFKTGVSTGSLFSTGTERMRIDSSGVISTVTTTGFSVTAGTLATAGYNAKAGISGAFSGNIFNINWTGSPVLYIDNTNVGTLATTSDYRVKRNIKTQTESGIKKVLKLRPVTYQMADYGDMFKASDEIKEGFIAHEVQEVIPSGAEGQKDEENRIQNLKVDAILSVAVKAIQEQQVMIEELKAKVAALEAA